ncbi:MAG: NAD(P)H-dependent oxidoreductase subunit E [Abditibacteriota bacterium]|nr:NAD(P)H-dependent oxidoreductase subunit E [Abditibacteriota bacterium]
MSCACALDDPEGIKAFVGSLVAEHGKDRHHLIPILQAIQSMYNYLPKELLLEVSAQTDIPLSNIYGVATFYAFFSLDPKGKNMIKVCNGTACHVRNNKPIIEAALKVCNIPEGGITSEDRLFSVEKVNCLGACGLAPAVVVNGKVYGHVTPDKITALINELKAKEEA